MFLSQEEIQNLGFKNVGQDCLIESRALILGANGISLGNNVRIDSFAVLSSQGNEIVIGDDVHMALASSVFGGGGVELKTGSGLAPNVSIVSTTEDYVWGGLSSPTIPEELRGKTTDSISLGEHVIVGTNSVVLPGSRLGFGAAVGALTLVKGVVQEFEIVAGNPMRVLGKRNPVTLLANHAKYLELRGRA
jgi:galactoside O-acetyltransferase